MKAVELDKVFNPREFENRIYQLWMDGRYFSPDESKTDPYVIVIPPPNVTGVLHLGHGLNNSLQDVLIRYHRMLGKRALWLPGTDHAGIATQNVVEKQLRAKGVSRRDLGREKFLEEAWKVKDAHHAIITDQLKKIGSSCDWERERFTLDDGLSRAVREVFVSLYEKGLIYRGNYLINWCPSCGTALSDDEVEHKEIHGKLYRYFYPLTDGTGRIEVATTRPETMLGDTAVAVNPADERYTGLIGKTVTLPLVGRELPIVADAYVDSSFGTGAVKVTPAHDVNDREIGFRHKLDEINILNPDGTLNENVPEKYRGLTAIDARKRVIEDLTEQGFFLGAKDHDHQIGHCYRCDSRIEPYLSEQWFVRMKPLAEKAYRAWETGEVRFYPKRWENTYKNWLNEIRDWCISRQLWWGHRVPVWYCADCGHMTVTREDPVSCEKCGSAAITQDEDVLDTWFSSWLWPFSTLGWPDETVDLATYYPTTTLVTAYDIIFFWVARMIMAGMEFMGKAPFRDVYMTPLVRDKQGRKMSKSLGNGIDPLEIVDEYGADALKFTIAFLSVQGQDLLIGKETFGVGSRFANKIWNATRYLMMNLEGRTFIPIDRIEPTQIDRWILHRLNAAADAVATAMESYRFNDASSAVYEFFWNEFCDWYIEASKLGLASEDKDEKNRTVSMLVAILRESLALMHPFMPFITEEIYQKLITAVGAEHGAAAGAALIVARYPERKPEWDAPEAASRFGSLQELVRLVRTLRSEFTIPPAGTIRFDVVIESGFDAGEYFVEHVAVIESLTGAAGVTFVSEKPAAHGTIAVVGTGFEAYVYVRDAIDVSAAIERLEKARGKSRAQLDVIEKKLANPGFLANAGEEIIAREHEKRDELTRKIDKMAGYLAELSQ